ncbi:MAG: DNA-directed RNA polymerase subunit omega [Candidatus Omnitrophota bacterium]
MAYQPIEKLLPRANMSIFKLVLLASKRATEIADGMPKLIDFPSSNKATTIALDEILEGKVELKEVATQREAGKEKTKEKGKEKT